MDIYVQSVDGGTRVTQHEEYRGIGVWFWDESWVEPAYAGVNEALGKRVIHAKESRSHQVNTTQSESLY